LPRLEGETLLFPIYLPEDFRAPLSIRELGRGPAVLEILSNPDKYTGTSLPVVGDIISPNDVVETFTRVTGKRAAYRSPFSRLPRWWPVEYAPAVITRRWFRRSD